MVLLVALISLIGCFETESYNYLTTNCVRANSVRLYFLERSMWEAYMLSFDLSGEQNEGGQKIIRKGPGPGELSRPHAFFIQNDHLFILQFKSDNAGAILTDAPFFK